MRKKDLERKKILKRNMCNCSDLLKDEMSAYVDYDIKNGEYHRARNQMIEARRKWRNLYRKLIHRGKVLIMKAVKNKKKKG